jgi:hypothetical protein
MKSLWIRPLCLLVAPIAAAPQATRPALALSTDIDTSVTVVRRLVDAVQGYFATPRPGIDSTPYWRASEQLGVPQYDPGSGTLGFDFPGMIVQITPDVPDDSVYVIKVLFATLDSTHHRFQPIALRRFYAVQENGAWVLTSALARHTATWSETQVGRIRYHYSPSHLFSVARARQAAILVDSLSHILGVPAPEAIDYYVAPSADEMARLLGFDWLKLPSGPDAGRGGWAGAHRVFSGDPRQGENYGHELAHIIAAPARGTQGRHILVEEGFATWIGGTAGQSVATTRAHLLEFARRHPSYPWEQMKRHSTPSAIRYATGALLVDAVFREAGWVGVRHLLQAGMSDAALFAALPRRLGITSETFEAWWRDAMQVPATPLAW